MELGWYQFVASTYVQQCITAVIIAVSTATFSAGVLCCPVLDLFPNWVDAEIHTVGRKSLENALSADAAEVELDETAGVDYSQQSVLTHPESLSCALGDFWELQSFILQSCSSTATAAVAAGSENPL